MGALDAGSGRVAAVIREPWLEREEEIIWCGEV